MGFQIFSAIFLIQLLILNGYFAEDSSSSSSSSEEHGRPPFYNSFNSASSSSSDGLTDQIRRNSNSFRNGQSSQFGLDGRVMPQRGQNYARSSSSSSDSAASSGFGFPRSSSYSSVDGMRPRGRFPPRNENFTGGRQQSSQNSYTLVRRAEPEYLTDRQIPSSTSSSSSSPLGNCEETSSRLQNNIESGASTQTGQYPGNSKASPNVTSNLVRRAISDTQRQSPVSISSSSSSRNPAEQISSSSGFRNIPSQNNQSQYRSGLSSPISSVESSDESESSEYLSHIPSSSYSSSNLKNQPRVSEMGSSSSRFGRNVVTQGN